MATNSTPVEAVHGLMALGDAVAALITALEARSEPQRQEYVGYARVNHTDFLRLMRAAAEACYEEDDQ